MRAILAVMMGMGLTVVLPAHHHDHRAATSGPHHVDHGADLSPSDDAVAGSHAEQNAPAERHERNDDTDHCTICAFASGASVQAPPPDLDLTPRPSRDAAFLRTLSFIPSAFCAFPLARGPPAAA